MPSFKDTLFNLRTFCPVGLVHLFAYYDITISAVAEGLVKRAIRNVNLIVNNAYDNLSEMNWPLILAAVAFIQLQIIFYVVTADLRSRIASSTLYSIEGVKQKSIAIYQAIKEAFIRTLTCKKHSHVGLKEKKEDTEHGFTGEQSVSSLHTMMASLERDAVAHIKIDGIAYEIRLQDTTEKVKFEDASSDSGLGGTTVAEEDEEEEEDETPDTDEDLESDDSRTWSDIEDFYGDKVEEEIYGE